MTSAQTRHSHPLFLDHWINLLHEKNSYILSLCGEMKWSILSVTCLFPESLCYAACCMGEGRRDTWNFVLLNYFFLILTMWHLLLMLWSELWGRWWECWNSPTLLHHLKTFDFDSISLYLSEDLSALTHLASLLCWPCTGVRLIVAMWWCWGSGWWLKIMLVWRWSLGYGDKDTAELPSKWKEQTFETQNQKLCI